MPADKEKLLEAIKNRMLISFTYQQTQRVVEPYHYGYLGGREQLHCFQIRGESHSGGIPQWRNFQLLEIEDLVIIPSHFKIRGDYNPSNANYSEIEGSVED